MKVYDAIVKLADGQFMARADRKPVTVLSGRFIGKAYYLTIRFENGEERRYRTKWVTLPRTEDQTDEGD